MSAKVICSKCEKEINCAIWEHPCFEQEKWRGTWWEAFVTFKAALDSTMLKAVNWFLGKE